MQPFRLLKRTALVALPVMGAAAWIVSGSVPSRQWQRLPTSSLVAKARSQPENAGLQAALTHRLLDEGRLEEAMEAANAAVRAGPENPEAWVAQGAAAAAAGHDEEALAAYDRAVERDPRTAGAYLGRARLHFQRQSSHGAVGELRHYTRLRPRDPEGWLLLTHAFLDLAAPGNAREAAQRAVALRPDAGAYYLLGESQRRAGALADAERSFALALDADPGLAPAWTGLGRVMLALDAEQLPASIEAFRSAVEHDPSDRDARYELGHALSLRGDREALESAIAEWRQVLAHHPEDTGAVHALAQALDRLDRPAEAAREREAFQKLRRYRDEAEALLRAVRQAPDPAAVQFDLARLHLRHGRADRALEPLREGLALRPDDPWGRVTLARLVEKTGAKP
jgi:tetratricopeptide (TPR) repeat protein